MQKGKIFLPPSKVEQVEQVKLFALPACDFVAKKRREEGF